jgi:hypothetical protein
MDLLEEPRNKMISEGKIAYSSFLDNKAEKR